jgi:hypothetical protein
MSSPCAVRIAAVIAFGYCGVAPAGAADPLVELARTSHTTSVESIRTLSCRVEMTETQNGAVSTLAGEYKYGHGQVRLRYKNGETVVDHGLRDNRRVSLFSGGQAGGKAGRATIKSFGDEPLDKLDVLMLGLLRFVAPDGKSLVRFGGLLDQGADVRKVESTGPSGGDLVHIDLEHTTSRLSFWFDPKVNFLVKKHIVRAKQATEFRSELEVRRFVEVTPGVYFPEVIDGRHFAGDKPTHTQTVAFKDIKVNAPLNPDDLTVRVPAGVEVADVIQGQVYIVDSQGKPVGKVRPLYATLSEPPAQPNDRGAVPLVETQAEPGRWSGWILPVAGGVLVAAGALWYVRRRRSD